MFENAHLLGFNFTYGERLRPIIGEKRHKHGGLP